MIDLIPGITFTDTEKQVYGSIAGALLGAIIGSLTTFVVTSHERKKQDGLHKMRQNQMHIHESAKALQSAKLVLTDLLVKCAANNQYVADIKKGLVKDSEDGKVALMQASSPFEYPRPDSTISQRILNDRIVTLWVNLCQEVELQNKNLSDFNGFYKGIFDTVHDTLLRGENIDISIIKSDNNTVMLGMGQQVVANAQLRKKCLELVAYIDCFNEHVKRTDVRKFKRLKDYRNFIGNISMYEPTSSVYETALISAEACYDTVTIT